MVDAMEKVALPALLKILDLTEEERNLLSIVYKKVTKKRRASLKITSSRTEKQAHELNDVCSNMLNVLEKQLIPSASTSESRVFYYTLKGDYHRYLSELATDNDQKDIENSLIAYKAASDIAVIDLPPINRIRLYLALNFSMFYEQISNSPVAAVAVDDIEELWRSDNEIQKNVIQRYLNGVIITEDDPGILIEFRDSRLLKF